MDTCPNCQKPLNHVEGRRKKVYCSATCRNAFWRKTAAKEPKYVLWKTYKELEEKYNALKSTVDFAHRPLVPNVPQEEAFHDPKLEAALKLPPKPLPQSILQQPPVLSYQELLRLAPEQDTREKREEFLKEVTRNRKLNANQKEAIHRKLPNLNS
jgi:hypothetical protein